MISWSWAQVMGFQSSSLIDRTFLSVSLRGEGGFWGSISGRASWFETGFAAIFVDLLIVQRCLCPLEVPYWPFYSG